MHFSFKKKKRKTPGYIIILHLCTKNLNDMIYSSWDIEHNKLKLVILGRFLLFYQKITQKNQTFEKMKKISGYIISNYVYQKSQSESEADILSLWVISCHFTTLLIQKIKILKEWKKIPEDITTWYMCTISKNHMTYGSWDMECDGQIFFIILDYVLPFYHSNDLKNQNLKTMKNYLEIS